MRSRLLRGIVFILAVMVCLAGVGASTFLAYEYVQIAPLPEQKSQTDKNEGDKSNDATTEQVAQTGPQEDLGALDRICTAFATWSCEKVSQSPYGRFPFHSKPPAPGVSTAELGLIFFIFVFFWLLIIRVPSPSRWWIHLFFTAVTAFGVGFSVLLEYLMWFKLEFRCPFCMVAHAAAALVFLFALLLWPRRPQLVPAGAGGADVDCAQATSAAARKRARPGFAAVVTLLMVVVLGVGMQHMVWWNLHLKRVADSMSDTQCQKDLTTYKWLTNYWQSQFRRYDNRWQHVVLAYRMEPVIPLKVDGEPFRGPADARHTIVLFSDPQCPACAKLDRLIHSRVVSLARPYGGVKLIYKHWPICPDCNKYATRNLHPEACKASLAMEAARMLGGAEKFWAMHDLLLANQARMKGVDEQWFVDLGRRLGLDPTAFAKAMHSKEAMDRIHAHLDESQNLGKGVLTGNELEEMKINATPTVFVDNRLLRTPQNLHAWQEIFKMTPPQVPASPSAASR